MTPEFRVSFPNVFEPRKNELSGKMEYSLVALFAHGADLSALKAAAAKVLVDKFGPDQAKWPTGLRSPFRDQAERARKDPNGVPVLGSDGKPILQDGHVAGAIFLNLKSNNKPGLVDQNVQDIIEQHLFYSGCYARATVRPYYYDQKGNRGVAFGLQNIQKVRDGDPLGGRSTPAQDFKPVEQPAGAPAAGAAATSIFG
jgi:hypothetical protein